MNQVSRELIPRRRLRADFLPGVPFHDNPRGAFQHSEDYVDSVVPPDAGLVADLRGPCDLHDVEIGILNRRTSIVRGQMMLAAHWRPGFGLFA